MNDTVEEYSEPQDNHTASHTHEPHQALAIIAQVWTPCLLLLGGFGNVATIFVMRRMKDHNSVQHIFIMALAVADLCCLYVGTLRRVISEMSGVDVRGLHTMVCKIHLWVTYSSNTVSAWLVTCITVQRTMAVLRPHRMRTLCTARKTWLTIAAVTVSAYIFQFHFILGREVSDNKCIALMGAYLHFCRYIFPLLNMCLSSLVPYVCQVVCDVILSCTLFTAPAFSSKTAGAATTIVQNTDSRRKRASSATITVLALSCAFVVLTLPMRVSQVWYHYRYSHGNEKPKVPVRVEVLLDVAFLLLYTNSAVNFILYCLTGTRFRREFSRWMLCQDRSGLSGGERAGMVLSGKGQSK